MNYRMILSLLGNVLLVICGVLLLPVLTALIYGESALYDLLLSIAISGGVGLALSLLRPRYNRTMHARDGFVMVSLAWIFISLAGALPLWLSGAIPSYLDAVFEAVSGFTTTGSSILTDVEAVPKCLLLWRSLMHWLGGMGVLVFMLAIVPLSGDSIYLLKAESPGPSVEKMVPKMRDSSLILYAIYLGMTLLMILLLQVGDWLGWGEISFFDNLCITFGTAGTGGFSIYNTGMANFSPFVQWVTTVFMALFGVNFSVYFFLLCKKWRLAVKHTEARWYFIIILSSIGFIVLNLMTAGGYFDTIGEAVRHVAFSVSSVITTTGYGTADFSQWPEFSRVILGLLMVVGACAGSTGGGLKVSRAIILVKTLGAEVSHLVHPHEVRVLKMDGKRLGKDVIQGASAYFIIYMLLLAISVLILSLDGFGTETTLSATLTTLNNIGPGLTRLIGPFGSFAMFSPLSKVVMILNMLFGRLEIFPMLLLLRPSTWRKH